MNIKFPILTDQQKGSVRGLVAYLEKEDSKRLKQELSPEAFFSHTRDGVPSSEVIQRIDANTRKLGKEDYKFYTFSINPSARELKHLREDPEQLKAYTRKVMEDYAKNFGKGLTAKDLLYFAKVEHQRRDRQTKQDKGEGNLHVHVIVSRRDQAQRYKLSPYSNAKDAYETSNRIKSSGFDRNWFRQQSEQVFDRQFDYNREANEMFLYQNTMKNGSYAEKKAVLDMVQEHRRAQKQEPEQAKALEQLPVREVQPQKHPSRDWGQDQGLGIGM